MNEMEFRQRAAELGYGEPQVKAYPPNATSELHTHDFSAFAMVAERGGGRHAPRRKVGSGRRDGVVRNQITRDPILSEGDAAGPS